MREGLDPRRWSISEPSLIRSFFAGQGKHVVYLAGYGELGYQDPGVVDRTVRGLLDEHSAADLVIHVGTLLRAGGEDGVAAAYRTAQELGVATTGIHPSVAMQFGDTHRVSPCCQHVFFVADDGWGGLDATGTWSPTLRMHLEVSDEIVAIGGGKHAAEELTAFHDAGRRCRFVPAEMNRRAALEWCRRAGIDLLEPQGAAEVSWTALSGR